MKCSICGKIIVAGNGETFVYDPTGREAICPACLLKRQRSKYGNERVEEAGERYDSKMEARRHGELLLLERGGAIADLQRQVRFPLRVNGALVCTYIADYTYRNADGTLVVEDVKTPGTRTDAYRIKKKLMAAVHGIIISEVEA